jgi:hypothetical protein
LRSLGRGVSAQVEFHQLDFGLALPMEPALPAASTPTSRTPVVETGSAKPPQLRSAPRSNITLRSNLVPTEKELRATIADWRLVPGDIVKQWQTDFLGPRFHELSEMQMEERNYYLPCSRCGRMLYAIRTEGPNEVCERVRCSEYRNKRPNGLPLGVSSGIRRPTTDT